MDFMTKKERETRVKIIEAHSHREEVKRFAKQINDTYELLNSGFVVDESSIGVERGQFKRVIVGLKERYEVDVLTINRGRQTLGWILAKEILEQ